MDTLNKFVSFYTDLASMRAEELASIYSQDVTFIDPIGKHQGIASVEAYFSKLLENAKHCQFTIQSKMTTNSGEHLVVWTMEYKTPKMNKGNIIKVEGLTLLKIRKDKISFHRDYFDLGQMIYENVPLLGRIIKRIKRSLS